MLPFRPLTKAQTTKKIKNNVTKEENSVSFITEFSAFITFFRSERTSAHSTQYSSRLGSFRLYSFSAVCQADDKVCHQLEIEG